MIAQLKGCEPMVDQQHIQREGQNHFIQHARKAHKEKMKKMKDGVREESIQEAPEVLIVIFQLTIILLLN
ncbi:hypothetical protein C1H46_002255 [Malus baccata]|uniref:Uncharacterized protein n=1 Tax=Malus baccata TaxID=106549 RepID=A0A540NMD5_MALBA|nr:hypothetical protein C1H46_002255 [Malus baccata]